MQTLCWQYPGSSFSFSVQLLSHISGKSTSLISHTFYCIHFSCRVAFHQVSFSAILPLQRLHHAFFLFAFYSFSNTCRYTQGAVYWWADGVPGSLLSDALSSSPQFVIQQHTFCPANPISWHINNTFTNNCAQGFST